MSHDGGDEDDDALPPPPVRLLQGGITDSTSAAGGVSGARPAAAASRDEALRPRPPPGGPPPHRAPASRSRGAVAAAPPRHGGDAREDSGCTSPGHESAFEASLTNGASGVLVKSRLPTDPALVSVAKRLTKALLQYYKRQPVKTGSISWGQFFSGVIQGGMAGFTFPQLENVVQEQLRAKVSRYELRCFWRRVDANATGMASLDEWTQLMYAVELGTWPDLTQEELDWIVKVLSDAAEKWHHAGGNWFKIFSAIDTDGSGSLSFNELQACVRTPFPGLRLKESDLPERFVQGLWKLLDSDGEIEVPVSKFMSFMRKHGAAHSMHRDTEYSLRKRGMVKDNTELLQAPQRTTDEFRAIIANLEFGLNSYFAARGLHSHGSSEDHWNRFFRISDAKGVGRLKYKDFCVAISQKLGKWVTISQDDVLALWALLDNDNSSEVSQKEMMLTIYRLDVETWPDDNDAAIEETITRLNAALKKRLNSEGNWYKAFNIVDADASGRLRFFDFKELVRDSFHGLSLPRSKLSDASVKAFWKRLDANWSGDVIVAEFMNFMRKHAGQKNSMHKLTDYTLKKRGLVKERQYSFSQEIANAPQFDTSTMAAVATRLTMAIHDWLQSRLVKVDPRNPQLWAQLVEFLSRERGGQRAGRLAFPEFLCAARTVLRVMAPDGVEGGVDLLQLSHLSPRSCVLLSEAHVLAFWRIVDETKTGEATPREFDRAVYSLQLETWPLLDTSDLERIVTALNQAADKWHRASGNWYKVFAACDSDGSGTLTVDQLFGFARDSYPGLSIPARVLSDGDLRGLWRALDTDMSGMLDVKEFMVFMRLHGAQHSMHRLTAHAYKGRGMDSQCQTALPDAPPRSGDELRVTARQLCDELTGFWRRRGVTLSARDSWTRFFQESDVKKLGRLSFFELEGHLRTSLLRKRGAAQVELSNGVSGGEWGEQLAGPAQAPDKKNASVILELENKIASLIPELIGKKDVTTDFVQMRLAAIMNTQISRFDEFRVDTEQIWKRLLEEADPQVVTGVRRSDLVALWHAVRTAAELPATRNEVEATIDAPMWRMGLYRLELESWPDATEEQVAKVVQKISSQAGKWHQAAGNWFKIFKIVQAGNTSDQLDFNELVDILKRPLPCLAMTDKQLPQVDMKALWKAMDRDRSGDVDIPEFMCFMRKFEARNGSHAPKAAVGSVLERARSSMKAAEKQVLSPDEVGMLGLRLCALNEPDLRSAYDQWGLPWDGTISEWDFVRVIRELVLLDEDSFSDDAVHLAWCQLDGSGSGQVPIEALISYGSV